MVQNLGPTKRTNKLEKSIGKWIVVTTVGNESIYGKIKEVDGRNLTFNPHRAFRYDANKKCNLYKFVNEDSELELTQNGYYLEPTTKETLDYITRENNKEILRSLKKNPTKSHSN